MKPASKLMLSALVAVLSVPAVQAAEAKLYGSYTGALVNTSDRKVEADAGLQETETFLDVSGNTYTTNKFGVSFKLDDSISGKVEAKIPSGADELTARKYYVTLAAPNGASVTVGRHDTPYSAIAGAADNLTLGADGGRGGYVAGAAYTSRNEAITVNSPALGPVVLTASLQKAINPGGNEGDKDNVKQTSTPALQLAGSLETKAGALSVGAGAAYHQEAVGIAQDEEETASSLAANAWIGGDKFKVVGVVTSGDPLFGNIVDQAVIAKDLEDSLNQTALWAQVTPNAETTLGLYIANEVAEHKATVKGAKDVQDQASSLGLNGTYNYKGVGLFAEYAQTERRQDGLLVDGVAKNDAQLRDVNSFGVGVNFAWGE